MSTRSGCIIRRGTTGNLERRNNSQLAKIFSICNLLRGPYKRKEYRKVILPLTVLRRFECLLAITGKIDVRAASEAEKAKVDASNRLNIPNTV